MCKKKLKWKWTGHCCHVESLCGYSLLHGVIYIGSFTIGLTFVTGVSSTLWLSNMLRSHKTLNQDPMLAMNIIFALVFSTLTLYQMVLSGVLLWQALYTKGNIFLCSVWYVSHLTILTIFFILFTARIAVCVVSKQYTTAIVTLVLGIVYEGAFVYFNIVVNSYLHSLPYERYM